MKISIVVDYNDMKCKITVDWLIFDILKITVDRDFSPKICLPKILKSQLSLIISKSWKSQLSLIISKSWKSQLSLIIINTHLDFVKLCPKCPKWPLTSHLPADKLQPRNINVSFSNNSNVPIDVIIFTFYSDQLTIDVETGIVTK